MLMVRQLVKCESIAALSLLMCVYVLVVYKPLKMFMKQNYTFLFTMLHIRAFALQYFHASTRSGACFTPLQLTGLALPIALPKKKRKWDKYLYCRPYVSMGYMVSELTHFLGWACPQTPYFSRAIHTTLCCCDCFSPDTTAWGQWSLLLHQLMICYYA